MRCIHRAGRPTSLVAAVAIVVAGCSTDDGRTLEPPVFPPPATTVASTPPTEPSDVVAPLRLVAPWRDGAAIPLRYTCDGDDIAPALTWADVPAGTVELAVTVTDLDAPAYVHWVVLRLPPDVGGLAEGALPAGALPWLNSSGAAAYAGPCPPPGEEHRYLYTVHALNQPLQPADGATASEIVEQLNLISTDQSSVSGTFARSG